jgi:predicted alpha/beta superfamily hydrolase
MKLFDNVKKENINKSRLLPFIFALWLVSFFSLSGEPIVIGETLTIDSKVLMKKATINIHLPASYQASNQKRYPVYFNLGDDVGFARTAGTLQSLSHNQEYPVPETIFVSLTTETSVSVIGRGVKSEDFINFLEIDVIPYIDKHYRTQPFRILASGERFGMAPLYSLIHKPKLFQAHITMSPWITDKSGLVSDFETILKSNKDISGFLWLSVSGESREASNYQKVISLLQQHAPQKLKWKSAQFNQYVSSLPSALVSVFADRYLASDSPVISAGVKSIKSYYQQLSDNKYGYAISSERAIRDLGIAMFNKERVKEAKAVFQINIDDYPDSPHVYANMASIFTENGDLTGALAMQKIAYELATKQNDAWESYYKRVLTDIKSKLSAK